MTRAAALVALLALGCAKKDPDPNHFKLADFHTDKQLTDTLKRLIPTGMREAAAWEMMQGNGFKCGERSATIVDRQTGTLGSGNPDLVCGRSTRINFGLRHRQWTVVFKLDSARVTDVSAGPIYGAPPIHEHLQ
jgi:hypothetical protein